MPPMNRQARSGPRERFSLPPDFVEGVVGLYWRARTLYSPAIEFVEGGMVAPGPDTSRARPWLVLYGISDAFKRVWTPDSV